jgi:hypothetical protein
MNFFSYKIQLLRATFIFVLKYCTHHFLIIAWGRINHQHRARQYWRSAYMVKNSVPAGKVTEWNNRARQTGLMSTPQKHRLCSSLRLGWWRLLVFTEHFTSNAVFKAGSLLQCLFPGHCSDGHSDQQPVDQGWSPVLEDCLYLWALGSSNIQAPWGRRACYPQGDPFLVVQTIQLEGKHWPC